MFLMAQHSACLTLFADAFRNPLTGPLSPIKWRVPAVEPSFSEVPWRWQESVGGLAIAFPRNAVTGGAVRLAKTLALHSDVSKTNYGVQGSLDQSLQERFWSSQNVILESRKR
jgi:hypothetical protein